MSDVIDLDALAPKPVTIKYGDSDIEIPPPKTADLIKLGSLSAKLGDAADLSTEQLDGYIDDLTNMLYKMVPELDSKPLNLAQLQKLVQILSEMAMPGDMKALKEQKITADTASKTP